jgi:hypothetical protein
MPTVNTRTHYLCIGPQCWGMATNIGASVAVAKRNWPRHGLQHFSYDLWHVPASTYVDAMGYTHCDVGDPPPLKLKEVRFDAAGRRHLRSVNKTAVEIAAARVAVETQ